MRGEILNSTSTCGAATAYLTQLHLPLRLSQTKPAADRLIALGLAQSHCNDFAGARKSFASAQSIAHAIDPQLEGSVLVRKADFEIGTQAWTEAESDIQTLVDIAAKTQNARLESRGWAAFGKLRGQQERFDEAIDANERALQIAQANSDTPLALVVRTNLGWLFVASGDYPRAIETLTSTEAEYARLGRKSDQMVALMQLGNAYLDQRDFGPARANYEKALAIATSLDHPTRAFLLGNLARVEFASGNYAAAQTMNNQALAIHQKRGDQDAAMRCLAMSGRIAEKLGKSGEPFYDRVLEKSHSRIARMEALYFRGEAKSSESDFRRALALADETRKELKSDEIKLAFTSTVDGVVNDLIDLLASRGKAVEALRVAESSRARTLRGKSSVAIDYREVAKREGPIVSYWMTPKASFAWLVTPSAINVVRLPPQDILAEAVDGYQKEIAGPRGSLDSIGSTGIKLWSTLVAPLAQLLGSPDRVVIVPDKHLYALNFETLVVPAPRPHFWIEDVTITTASSIELLARPQSGTANAKSLLLVGDPASDGSLPPLPWAQREIERVRAHFADATVIDGPRATPAAYVATATPHYGYVHFVAHGIGNPIQPLDSAIVLGRKLYARDIIKHPLDARLVTISSCHGAGQRAYAGEGLVGLAWAFLRAGAHQVIGALWEVSDSATPDLMDFMYGRIQQGDDPASALRAAKLQLLHSGGVYRRPLYWAPFVLYSGA